MKKTLTLLAIFAINFNNYSQNILPIPPLNEGIMTNDVRTFDLEMADGITTFFEGIETPTSGYNGSFLGETLLFRKGDQVSLNVTNHLGERTTTHWHGFHLPAAMDGGPHQMIADNSTWTASWTILNNAATYWYHPHLMPTNGWTSSDGTGGQVYRGLAGMIIVEDDEADALNLPDTYGVDDIPLIFTDRAFNPDGTFLEFMRSDVRIRKGDTPIINGAVTPVLETHAQMIRFRLLNGSNGRIYYFGLSDNSTFTQIGSDGGLLAAPVDLERLELAPGERAEIIIDFSNDNGNTIELMSFASELAASEAPVPVGLQDAMDNTDYTLMTFDIGEPTTTTTPIFSIPSQLVDIPLFDPQDAVNVDNPRPFVLISENTMQINGVEMDLNVINETVNLDDIEVWEIINTSGQDHPFHVHGEPFQVIFRSDGEVPENEKGWKDVVLVPGKDNTGDGVVRIIKQFKDFADSSPDATYMYHCHILEHEDLGMMGQFQVIDNTNNTENGEADDITIMTYNIGSDDWIGNQEQVVSIMKRASPDILTVIQATENTRPYLEDNLIEYQLLPTLTDPNDSEVHIFFKNDLFNVINSGVVSLETYGGYTGRDRHINWAQFEERSSQHQFFVYGSHMVFIQPTAIDSATVGQFRHANAMIKLMSQHATLGIPQITVGDYNAVLSSDVLQFILEQKSVTFQTTDGEITMDNPIALDDSWDIANPNTTKPGTVGEALSTAIDWIIVTPDVKVSRAIVDVDAAGASEHVPLIIHIGEEEITSLSIPEAEANGLTVYPNPFSATLQFDLASIGRITDDASITIHDVTGKIVYQSGKQILNDSGNQLELNLDYLPQSIYYYKLVNSGLVYSGLLFKSSSATK
jgi:bilirubin oxidase